ncbi:MAG: hypothetical protein IJ158_06050 [Treponema sp.]|nr:hypothetical protein [Treponema sp.]
MLGVFLNLILFSLAALVLASGVSFFVQERDSGYSRLYMLLLAIVVFLTCGGYSIMGFTANLSLAPLPRFIGLAGIDVFLIVELSYLLMELRKKRSYQLVLFIFFALYVFFDLLIFGKPSALTYIRYEFHTAYENANKNAHLFHYAFITVMLFVLLYHGIKWYKSKNVRRDRAFSLELILSNFALLFAALPDMFNLDFAHTYPTFGYSAATAFVFFSYLFAIRQHISYTPTVKNVSREVFSSIEVPVIIFDTEGMVNLSNPCAKSRLQIADGTTPSLRNLFALSDVETMRLLTRTKNGWSGAVKTRIKANDEACTLTCSIKCDNVGETFCVIGTVLPEISEKDKDEKNAQSE